MTAQSRTPGKWEIYIAPAGMCDEIVNEDGERICEFPYGCDVGDDGHADAAFIVQACNAYDTLRAQNAALVAALHDTIPALIRLGDFVGNIDNGGPSKQGTIYRCALLLKVREALADANPDTRPSAALSQAQGEGK